LNGEGIPIEIVYPPFVLNLIKESIRYPFNRFLRLILKHTLIKKVLSKYRQGLLKPQKRLLFCPKAIALANKDPRFQLMRHNLLKASPLSRPVDVFRAMNIFNTSYFTPNEFKVMITQIFGTLSDKGLVIVGSNQDSNTIVHGIIFQKTKDRFEKIGQSGDGLPMENLFLDEKLI
jgi:hypothetical protein